MANRIEPTNITVAKYVDSSSRYLAKTSVVYYSGRSDKKVLTFTTYKRQAQVLSINDKFAVIDATTQYRPDVISNKVYGFPHMWWKIMEFNGIHDVFDFKAGKTIRLPELI